MFIYATNLLEIYYKKEISLTVNITITHYIKRHKLPFESLILIHQYTMQDFSSGTYIKN